MELTTEQLDELVKSGKLTAETASKLSSIDANYSAQQPRQSNMTAPASLNPETPTPLIPPGYAESAPVGPMASIAPIVPSLQTLNPPPNALDQLQKAGVNVSALDRPMSPPLPIVPEYIPEMGGFKIIPPGSPSGTGLAPGALLSDKTVVPPSTSPQKMLSSVEGHATPSIANQHVAALGKAIDESNQITKQAQDIEQKVADATVLKNEETSNQAKAIADKFELDKKEMETHLAAARADAEKADLEASARAKALADRTIDPDRRNFLQKILGAVAIGVGAYGAGLGHGPNTALEIVNDSISRDIEAQKIQINNAKDSDKALRDISIAKFGRAMSRAELESTSALTSYKYALDRVDMMAKLPSAAQTQGSAEMLKAGLQEKANFTKNQIVEQQFKVRQDEANRQREGAVAGAAKANQRKEEFQKLTAKFMEGGKSLNEAQLAAAGVLGVNVGDQPGIKKENSKADDAKKQGEAAANEIEAITKQMENLRAQGYSYENQAKYNALAGQLRPTILRAHGLKRYTELEDEKIVTPLIPTYTSGLVGGNTESTARGKFDALRDLAKRTRENGIKDTSAEDHGGKEGD